jgi:(1->4)-alpha-D-glucan 1-alpha-D-glucosylmutase
VLADPWTAPARRFQQTSGMVMAKGVEDCAFYRWSRLTSLNEVGGDPSLFSLTVPEFHEAMTTRQERWPHAMTTLSTHDTKRGEDFRARIAVLAELPGVWARALDELLALAPVPDPGFGSLLWQAVLGAWTPEHLPDLPDRLHGYAEKAMREAGDRTTWTEPDAAYEAAVHAAVDAVFASDDVRRVLTELAARIEEPGRSNSLSAKLVAITMPGVPDVYQGSELWETSLVDPDNRRPVDFDHRADVLAGDESDDAVDKLHVTCSALRLRRERPALFTSYAPLAATGPASGHVLAFDRGGAITVATRLPVGLDAAGGWGETSLELPDGRWHDVLTGTPATGRLADLLATHPVALLVREDA